MSASFAAFIGSFLTTIAEQPLKLSYINLLPFIIRSLYITQFRHSYLVRNRPMRDFYDYIVVGAGSAGSVMAARLSENPNVNVLLLECGGPEILFSDIPSASYLLQKTPVDWNYKTEPQNYSSFGLNNRQVLFPRGQ